MLKTRIIGVVVVRGGIAVQSIGFRRYLPIGKPEIAVSYLDRWGVDEIVLLHIDATKNSCCPLDSQVLSYSSECMVPLSVGGGIAQVSDVKRIIQAGADKVVINSALISNSAVITEAATSFGSQSVVVSIDACRQPDGTFVAFTHAGAYSTGLSARKLAQRAEELGAGEIFLNSIDRDGSKQGYDLDLIRSVVDAVNIPVIACGGAGHPKHMVEAMECGVSAVAAANFFHFTEHSVIVNKHFLRSTGVPVRLDSYATYQDFQLDQDGRVAKRSDEMLEALRFRYLPEEKI